MAEQQVLLLIRIRPKAKSLAFDRVNLHWIFSRQRKIKKVNIPPLERWFHRKIPGYLQVDTQDDGRLHPESKSELLSLYLFSGYKDLLL